MEFSGNNMFGDKAPKKLSLSTVEENPNISDVSFTPERIRGSGSSKGTTGYDSDQKERIRGSGSSKGTTGYDSDQKERIRGIGFVNRNWIHSDSADSELPIPIQNH
ncbi:hypothetical protein AVEN_244981-1 [Araneus ventricosus]|uniref:Uncharacterized protein n=1 Tax=Araneus ventricosus TaxID=182803 RepID=A0A4Y2F3C9_ARAVE|nr:hypothetical protein AVEN_244981-1 [Araneus ventricosus]